jgi:hypothetical protein
MRQDGLLLLAGAFMMPNSFRLAFCGAALQAGYGGTPLMAVKPTLVLEDYVEGAPRGGPARRDPSTWCRSVATRWSEWRGKWMARSIRYSSIAKLDWPILPNAAA